MTSELLTKINGSLESLHSKLDTVIIRLEKVEKKVNKLSDLQEPETPDTFLNSYSPEIDKDSTSSNILLNLDIKPLDKEDEQKLNNLLDAGFIQKEEYENRKKRNEFSSESDTSQTPYSGEKSLDSDLPPLSVPGSWISFGSNEYTAKPEEAHIGQKLEQNKSPKIVRVFVSSVLRDMDEEHKILRNYVFPELRNFCHERGLKFVYVGNYLMSCVNLAIDRCRPYMISLLGSHYGWSRNGNLQDRVLEQSFQNSLKNHPWLIKYTDRSVTEIEILYGALFYPTLAKALFYFQKDQLTRSALHETREQQMLYNLKKRIESSGLLLRNNFNNPNEFAHLVLKDLKDAIIRDFPLITEKEEPFQKEMRLIWNFVKDKTSIYAENVESLSVLNQHVKQNSETPLFVTGPSGSGKTSLLCKWIVQQQETQKVPIIAVFVGLFHTQVYKLIYFILENIKFHFKINQDLPKNPTEILTALNEWLLLTRNNGKMILILDGINEVSDTSLSWLPTIFPPNVRVIVTCNSNCPTHVLLSSEKFKWNNKYSITPLNNVEKRQIIENFTNKWNKKLSHNETHELVSAFQTENPLYLRTVLSLLKNSENSDTFINMIQNFTQDVNFNLKSLYESMLSHWEKCSTINPSYLKDMLCFLYISRYGLSESELLSIVGVDIQMYATCFFSFLGEELYVDQDGLIHFAHDYLRLVIQQRYLPTDLEISYYRTKLISYFGKKELTQRKIEEYPWQLQKLNKKEEMYQFLSDITVFSELYTPLYKYDFLSYWKVAGAESKAFPILKSSLLNYKKKSSEKEFCAMQLRVAKFVQETGNPAEAILLFEEILPIYKNLYPDSKEMIEFLYEYGLLHVMQKNYDMAEKLINECLSLSQQEDKYEDEKVILHYFTVQCIGTKALIKKNQGDFSSAVSLYESILAIDQNNFHFMKLIADIYSQQSLIDKSEIYYNRALTILRQNYGHIHPTISECLDALGLIHIQRGNHTAAKSLFLDALSAIDRVQTFLDPPTQTHEMVKGSKGTGEMVLAGIYQHLGDVEYKLSNLKAAMNCYEKAFAINEKHVGPHHPNLIENLNSLGILSQASGNLESAIRYIERAVSITQKNYGTDDARNAPLLNNLAACYSANAHYDKAEQLCLSAMRINENKLGKNNVEIAENMMSLAEIEKKRGKYDLALNYTERSIEIFHENYGETHPKVASCSHNLGMIYRKMQMFEKSGQYYQKALSLHEKLFGLESQQVATDLNGLGMLLKQTSKDLDTAAEYHLRAKSIFERHFGENHVKVASTLNLLAEVYRKQGKFGYDGAEKLYEEALAINRANYGEEHPEVAENLNGLAQVYKSQMNYSKAEPLFLKAISISERTLGPTHQRVCNRYRNLANMYECSGRIAQSVVIHEKIKRLETK